MEVPYLIVVVVLDIPEPSKTSKLKHWYRYCKWRVSCIPWRRVAGSLGKALWWIAKRIIVKVVVEILQSLLSS